ncbi:hypothetical protein SALBM311S_11467 [Streptomyces alboniger]
MRAQARLMSRLGGRCAAGEDSSSLVCRQARHQQLPDQCLLENDGRPTGVEQGGVHLRGVAAQRGLGRSSPYGRAEWEATARYNLAAELEMLST